MVFIDDDLAFPIGRCHGLTKGEYEAIHRKNSRGLQVYLAAINGLYSPGYARDYPNRAHVIAVEAAKIYERDTAAPR